MLDDAQAAATPPYDVTAMVVLTDGMWNRPPSLAAVSGSITANIYAVGLGLPIEYQRSRLDHALPGAQRVPSDHGCALNRPVDAA